MKKALKFSGAAAALLAAITFILMLACPALKYVNGSLSMEVAGTTAIFGKSEATGIGSLTINTSCAWSALIAWIFVLVAMLILIAGVVLPLLKVHALDKFAGILNLVAVALLVIAGIFMFISKATFGAANDVDVSEWSLGAGWVIGGIISILAGVVAILPAVFDFIGKNK